MTSTAPICLSSDDEDYNIQPISTTVKYQKEQHSAHAKARLVPQQSLSDTNIGEDQPAPAVKVERPRFGSVEVYTLPMDYGGDVKRSLSVPQLTATADDSETEDHQLQLHEQTPPSVLKTMPVKRKSSNNLEPAVKRSRVITLTTTPSNASDTSAVMSGRKTLSRSAPAYGSDTDSSGSDRTYHPPLEEMPKSVPQAPATKVRSQPLRLSLFADFINELQRSFDFHAFAARHEKSVKEIMEIFEALVAMPFAEYTTKNKDKNKLPEARAIVKEHKRISDVFMKTGVVPEKRDIKKGLLATAARNARRRATRANNTAKKE